MKSKKSKKFDSEKPDFTQIPQEGLLEVAKVFTLGGKKYGQFNYSDGFEYRRLVAASNRHLNQWLRGEDIDEIGTNHVANAIADLLILLDNIKTGRGVDNRNKIYKNKKKK